MEHTKGDPLVYRDAAGVERTATFDCEIPTGLLLVTEEDGSGTLIDPDDVVEQAPAVDEQLQSTNTAVRTFAQLNAAAAAAIQAGHLDAFHVIAGQAQLFAAIASTRAGQEAGE